MITIEKEKPAKRELKLFSVEVALTQDVEDGLHLSTNVGEYKEVMKALLKVSGVNPEECKNITTHAAKALVRDFMQQIVNLSDSLDGAEIEDLD